MRPTADLHIAVFPGDGIGLEITDPCLDLLDAVCQRVGGFALSFTVLPAGAASYRDSGHEMPAESLATARGADAILLAAMGLPDVRHPDGTEITPQIALRLELGLYAGVRPVRSIPGIPSPLAAAADRPIDFVLVRESTEGLFASLGKGVVEADAEARETLVITRDVCERLFDFSLTLGRARKRQGHPGRVTCVDKANVFAAFAFFRKIFDERAARFPDLAADHAYVDATALKLVRDPWSFDVLVTENMFGDILSDLGAALVGGLGVAPSADIGDRHAVFQPCHGTAPDIAGKGIANPTAMILSAAMMLDWLGDRNGVDGCRRAAAVLVRAVDAAFADGALRTREHDGTAGTLDVYGAVSAQLDAAWASVAAGTV